MCLQEYQSGRAHRRSSAIVFLTVEIALSTLDLISFQLSMNVRLFPTHVFHDVIKNTNVAYSVNSEKSTWCTVIYGLDAISAGPLYVDLRPVSEEHTINYKLVSFVFLL